MCMPPSILTNVLQFYLLKNLVSRFSHYICILFYWISQVRVKVQFLQFLNLLVLVLTIFFSQSHSDFEYWILFFLFMPTFIFLKICYMLDVQMYWIWQMMALNAWSNFAHPFFFFGIGFRVCLKTLLDFEMSS